MYPGGEAGPTPGSGQGGQVYPGGRSAGGEAGCTRGSGQGGQVYPGGLECGRGGRVYPGVRAGRPGRPPGLPPDPAEVGGKKKKGNGEKRGTGNRGKRRKNRPGAGPLRHATRGHLLPARPAEEGGGGPGQTPRPRSARGTQGRGRARARRPAPLLRQQARSGTAPRGACCRPPPPPGRTDGRRPQPRAKDKSLCRGLILNRSQRGSCSATYETLTQNQVVYE